ncbi:MAG: hypothetical protein GX595_12075 [Lentisphaerae bacterium]|nr:hypothetical protein [Lentisphaerota bacterium]
MNTLHQTDAPPLLLGSTFPLSLIRRRVEIEPVPLDALRAEAARRPVVSFWGHSNTLPAARAILGIDVTPGSARPALTLSVDGLPCLDGVVFDECWVLSPDYVSGYRPTLGEDVPVERITGWQVLKMRW